MEKLIIDRFEGQYAVCEKEDKSHISIDFSRIPAGVKEGDCLLLYNSGKIVTDGESTRSRKNKLNRLMEQLKQNE